MIRKAKKGPVTVFKITPKTENEDAQIKELQVKKKILEEKLRMYMYNNYKILKFYASLRENKATKS